MSQGEATADAAVKFAVVGAYCSGKTTLTNDILAAYPAAKLMKELPRQIIAIAGNGALSHPAVRDYLLVSTLIAEAELSPGLWIADGGLVNNLAHDAVLLDNPPERQPLLHTFAHRPYTAIFWCDPADVTIEDDGARFVSASLRERLDKAVETILRSQDSPFVRVSGEPERRRQVACEVIERYLDAA